MSTLLLLYLEEGEKGGAEFRQYFCFGHPTQHRVKSDLIRVPSSRPPCARPYDEEDAGILIQHRRSEAAPMRVAMIVGH